MLLCEVVLRYVARVAAKLAVLGVVLVSLALAVLGLWFLFRAGKVRWP
jgi:hypothetical protein